MPCTQIFLLTRTEIPLFFLGLTRLLPWWLSGKEPAWQETQVQSLGWEDPLE